MARSEPDVIWTIGTGGATYGSAYTISFTGSPKYGTWGSMSFAFGVSQTKATSSTLYSTTMLFRDSKSWYDNVGIVTNLCNSGPSSDAAKSWSATIYPVKGSFQSATNAKQYFFAGVSFPAKAPAGVYKFHLDIHGQYSQTTSNNVFDHTHSYTYYDRPRTSALSGWTKATAHPVFSGGKYVWRSEPYIYRDDLNDSDNYAKIKGGQTLSASDERLTGPSYTEAVSV